MSSDVAVRERLLAALADLPAHRLAVVGDYMLDVYLFGDVNRISAEAPVPVVSVERETRLPGGAGNVARNLCALGLQPVCCGFIGDDKPGHHLREDLATLGADVTGLVAVPGMETTRKTRVLAKSQQVVRVDRDNRVNPSGPAFTRWLDEIVERLASCQGLLLSDYDKGMLSTEVTSRLIAAAHAHGLKIVADPKPQNMPLFAGATVVCPNAPEAHLATGIACEQPDKLREAATKLIADLSLEAAVITRGAHGMYLLTAEGDESHLPTVATQVADVTGAGDTVAALLAAALVSGHTYLEAAQLANIAAGLVVQHLGCAVVEPDELAEAIRAAEL
jgi:D-beta-D-heptose 7-phosphate kinase/D-beta-D-heptose 1-phosphate adenosyltransferase